MKLLHIANGQSYNAHMLSPAMCDALEKLGDFSVLTRGSRMSPEQLADTVRGCDVLLTGWGSIKVPEAIAQDRGQLGYICNITGEMRHYVLPCHITAGIPVTNWGDTIAPSIAEGAMALMFAVMKNIRPMGKLVEGGFWGAQTLPQTSLYNLRVGIFGLGVIGRKFVEYIAPYDAQLSGFDPYLSDALWPSQVRRVASLDALMDDIDVLIVHAGLTPETYHAIKAEHLAKLPRDGIIINTARGGIIDQDALMAEVASGRIRAGIDVLSSQAFGDALSPNDPARHYPNLVLTCHGVGGDTWPDRSGTDVTLWQAAALENISSFAAGRPLKHTMDITRYERST